MSAKSPAGSLQWLLSPFMRLAARLAGRESPWERVTMRVPASAFGPGSRQPFAGYFEGETCIRVRSIDELVAWLQTCEYVTDAELFHEQDVWQHPGAFERLRRGDCEDFALWAWRKLAEIGIEAEFYVGRVLCDDHPEIDRQHAWVVYRANGAEFLFEPAARTTSRMIRPLADAMGEYVPHFAVSHRFDTTAFVGCASDSHRRRLSRRDPPARPDVRSSEPRYRFGLAGVATACLTVPLDGPTAARSGQHTAAPPLTRGPARRIVS